MMVREDSVVRLELPVDTRYIRVARLVAGGMAATAGLDMDSVDDLRIAVDEVCAALFELADGGPVTLTFALGQDAVEVEGHVRARPAAALDQERFSLSEQILAVACDGYTMNIDDEVARFTLQKRL